MASSYDREPAETRASFESDTKAGNNKWSAAAAAFDGSAGSIEPEQRSRLTEPTHYYALFALLLENKAHSD